MGIATFGNNSYGQCGRPIIENEDYFGNRSVIKDITKYLQLEAQEKVVCLIFT